MGCRLEIEIREVRSRGITIRLINPIFKMFLIKKIVHSRDGAKLQVYIMRLEDTTREIPFSKQKTFLFAFINSSKYKRVSIVINLLYSYKERLMIH